MYEPQRALQNPQPLAIGVAIDGPEVPAWIARVAFDLTQASFLKSVEFSFVRLGAGGGELSADGTGATLFDYYCEKDRSRAADNYPLEAVNLLASLPPHSFRHVPLAEGDWDVLLWLGSDQPTDEIASRFRLGVWTYRHGALHGHAGRAEYFWELYNRQPVSVSGLDMRAGDGQRRRIAESYSATEMGWSLARNRAVPYWKAGAVIVKALREMTETPDRCLRASPVVAEDAEQPLPTTAQMLKFAVRNGVRTATRRLLYSKQEPAWFIAYRTNTAKFVSEAGGFSAGGFRKLEAPHGHFYADPFVEHWRGRNYLFFEDYLYSAERGVLACLEFDETGPVGEPVRILDLPYHLSYPFVFQHAGELYMIPETLAAKRVELYTADHPMGPWRLAHVLQENLAAADTSLWIDNGLFYFLTSVAEGGVTPNEQLHIYYSDSLIGKWQAHRQNPLSSDVRSSRGAGKLFHANGKLIRPAQDCSVRYGYACQLNEVEVITTDEYRERPWSRINPDWMPGLIGTHTLNAAPGLEVIDGQVLARRYRPAREPQATGWWTKLRAAEL